MSNNEKKVDQESAPAGTISDQQHLDGYRTAVSTKQHHRSHAYDTGSTISTYKAALEIPPRDFVRILPAEIVYQIFEPLGFYDFVTCTRVSSEWKTVLMCLVWPQNQEYFFSLYPLFPLHSNQRAAIVNWLQGSYQFHGWVPPSAFRHIRYQLEHSNYLRYRHESENAIYLGGASELVLSEIRERIATIEALIIQSTISASQTSDLFLRLASCRQLKRLKFGSNLEVRRSMKLGKQPQLSITYLSINRINVTGSHDALPIDFLKQTLLLCPLLRELVLRVHSRWGGSVRRILQICPSALSAFTLKTTYPTHIPIAMYKPTLYARAFQKLSLDLRYSDTDWDDLHDAIASVTGTLEILCVTFPSSSISAIRRQNILSMTETFRHCHRLHTADIQCGSIANVLLKAMSSIPNLECIHFGDLLLIDDPRELLYFFNETNARIKRIYLADFDHTVDDNILQAISKFSSLQALKVTAFPFPDPPPKVQYSDDMIQKLMTRNPQLELIDEGSDGGIHLEALAND